MSVEKPPSPPAPAVPAFGVLSACKLFIVFCEDFFSLCRERLGVKDPAARARQVGIPGTMNLRHTLLNPVKSGHETYVHSACLNTQPPRAPKALNPESLSGYNISTFSQNVFNALCLRPSIQRL
jgi:hypothetical protein